MKDYQFKYNPSLMQKLSVYQLKKNRVFANWCGTGAGKTNSALIASRETNSRITVIICPNSVKQSWIDAINIIYPNNTNIIKKIFKYGVIIIICITLLSPLEILNCFILQYINHDINTLNK